MSSETSAPRRRSRYSLRALLALTTFIAMAIVLAMFYKELVKLRADVRRLRNEVGELSIDDPAKVYAMSVRTDEPFTWKWRVWLPAGRRYKFIYASENIPKAGFPKPHGYLTIDSPGEHWIEYRIRKDPNSGLWMDSFVSSSGSIGSSQQDWVAWPRSASTGEGVQGSTEFAPDVSVLLARRRVGNVPNSSQIPDPAPGFMLWFEPLP